MCKKVIIGSNGVKLDTCQIFNLRLTHWIQTSLAWCLLIKTHGMLIWINTNRYFGGTVSACWRQRNSSCFPLSFCFQISSDSEIITNYYLQISLYRIFQHHILYKLQYIYLDTVNATSEYPFPRINYPLCTWWNK